MSEHYSAEFWEQHWSDGGDGHGVMDPNPYLVNAAEGIADSLTDGPGRALEAGCGPGTEALWLARHGWQVTGADISATVLEQARDRERALDAAERPAHPVRWVQADLSQWEPNQQFDLVTTHYAHPTIPQLDFYQRVAGWVAPGGTLLIVGHRRTEHSPTHSHGHDDHGDELPDQDGPPEHAPVEIAVTAESVIAALDELDGDWEILSAEEPDRTLGDRPLHDVVVVARRH